MSCKNDYYTRFFSHIYVEKEIRDCEETQKILNRFSNCEVVLIDKYMDIFGRGHQNILRQHKAQNLILAKQTGECVYHGSRNCQSFNHDYFYYTSNMMNCIYDCEYCYLKGMYPSSNIVYFINIEDTFLEIEDKLKRHPVYVSVSYNTDLLALEQIFHVVSKWQQFVEKHEDLSVEVRTKCGSLYAWDELKPLKNMIYAFTISPDEVIKAYEHGTPGLEQRLGCANELIKRGYSIRLCFDPMIYCMDWKRAYEDMLNKCSQLIDLNKVLDFSVGSFRISQDYMKNLRKMNPDSSIVWFPYENVDGVYQYPDILKETMQSFLMTGLSELVGSEKIFCWEGV